MSTFVTIINIVSLMKVAGSMIKFVKHKPDMQSGVLSGLASGWIQYTFLTGILQWRHNEHDGSQITGVSIICSPVCSGADQRKHQSSASLAFGRGIDRWPVDSPHKGPVMPKMFPFDDVIMKFCIYIILIYTNRYKIYAHWIFSCLWVLAVFFYKGPYSLTLTMRQISYLLYYLSSTFNWRILGESH